jgi:alkanesulfonate monooxygenase SsuD/methylene tetrahydromethanopterin reductase-like flavin-dependent oxidoreductase (luciferase family)
VIAAYRRGAEAAGREPGEIILQTLASWAPTDDEALAASREWKGTLVDEHYLAPIADPAAIGERGAAEISDKELEQNAIVSSGPATHVKKLRMLEKLGATTVVVMNVSAADPEGALKVYGEQVLPELRS